MKTETNISGTDGIIQKNSLRNNVSNLRTRLREFAALSDIDSIVLTNPSCTGYGRYYAAI